jgi:hypothetical protein
MRAFIAVAALSLLGACVSPPAPPVPVSGDVAMLAGHWSGEYTSNETGRSGSITFTLDAGTDTAQGDVLMIPSVQYPNYVSQYVPEEPARQAPQPLRIQLVRVFGHQVAGQLLPYKDPECGCTVNTIFSGRLDGNMLVGVFHTYHPDGRTVTGEWRVKRSQ